MSEVRSIPGVRRSYGARLYTGRRRTGAFTPWLTVSLTPFARPMRLAIYRWGDSEWRSSTGIRMPARTYWRLGPLAVAYTGRVCRGGEWE